MTLRHFRIFLAVCDADCSVSGAAKKLCLSQPAVSTAIRELEEHYGVRLFDRLSRRLCLTEDGKAFREYAGRIVTLCDDVESEFAQRRKRSLLRVGASLTVGAELLPGIAAAFQREHPETELRVVVAHSRDVEEQIRTGSLDLGFVETRVEDPVFHTECFLRDRLVAAARAGDPPAGRKISLSEFVSLPLLLREKGSGTRDFFDAVMEQHGIRITPRWESASSTALLHAAESGFGVCVLPRRTLEREIQAGVLAGVLVEGLTLPQNFYIICHRDKVLTPSMRAFAAAAEKIGNAGEETKPEEKKDGICGITEEPDGVRGRRETEET